MSMTTLLRFLSPILAPFFTIVTLIVCIIITKTNDIYVGSLAWPYFSDMGRDDPAYYVFVVGLCLTAFFLILTWYFNYTFQVQILTSSIAKTATTPSLERCSIASTFMGIISTIGLPILSIYRVSYPHPEIHNYAAYFFFLFQAAAVLLNTYVTHRLLKIHESIECPSDTLTNLRRTWHIQIIFSIVFLVAFLIYLPIGLAIVCDFTRLTISKCINELNLGFNYCTNEMALDSINTKLYDYSNCYDINQLRAGAQLTCILTLVGYALSFHSHRYNNNHTSYQNNI